MDLNARVDVNCGRKDGRTENRTPISHLAKAGATKMAKNMVTYQYIITLLHSERPKLYTILAFLSAIRLNLTGTLCLMYKYRL